MKILQDSRHQLRLKNTPEIFAMLFMLIWSSGFMGIPFFMMGMFAKDLGVTTVTCNRPEPSLVSCAQQRSTYLGMVQQPAQDYSGVIQAQLNTEEGRDSDGDLTHEYWVSLETSQGSVRLVEGSIMMNGVKGNKSEMAAIAQKINDFIQSSESELTFEQDNRFSSVNLAMMAFMALFPLIGLISIYNVFQTEELTFDRELGLLQRRRQTLLGPRSQDLPMHSITGSHIDTSRSSKRNTHSLKLRPKTLRTRPIMLSHSRSQVKDIQQKIQDFLNVT